MNKQHAKLAISRMKVFNIDALNRIATRNGISLTLAVFYFNALH